MPKRSAFELQKVSDNFFVYEVVKTEQAAFAALNLQSFQASPELHFNAARFAWTIAEPFRAHRGGRPLAFASWFRCPALNASLPGSSATSLHVSALGADPELAPEELESAWRFFDRLPACGEVILYLDTRGRPKRLHVSARGAGAEGDRLIKYADGKTVAASQVLLNRAFA